MAEVFVFLTDGTEECEALLMVDLLRRAEISVATVAVGAEQWQSEDHRTIVSLHNVPIVCDMEIGEIHDGTGKVFFIPGGTRGVENFKANAVLTEILRNHQEQGLDFVSVCAGPTVLAKAGILEGKKSTVYPGMEKELAGAIPVDESVVTDEHVLTGRALGASIKLGRALIEKLRGKATADRVMQQICYEED
ncbi:MAG: DJ-1/PfpI family protein [Peptoniphilaceae bacterium]|nr:DJ-1/PfpI family protein [Peptoniphilaceae bacterium]